MDLHGHLLGDQRRLLRVKPGHRGLAQSEMVFQHTRNLPDLLEALDLSGVQVKAIGVSAKPRPREESYMRLLVGLGMAREPGETDGTAGPPVHPSAQSHVCRSLVRGEACPGPVPFGPYFRGDHGPAPL